MSIISRWYDRVNGDEYVPYADFLQKVCGMFSKIKVTEVLDIGCGTGGITRVLADRGFDMIGLDISPDMLSAAPRHDKILYICRDMRDFELYGSVQMAFSSYDCINYLHTAYDIDAAFSNTKAFLEPGGLFVFDLNTRYRAENIYDGRTYCFESGADMLVWQAAKKDSFVDFYLTSFTKTNGCYVRDDEILTERIWSHRTICSSLHKNGFRLIGVYGSKELTPLTDRDEKAYYIAERI